MQKSNYYGDCNRCKKPEKSCGCSATKESVTRYMDVKIEVYDCSTVYAEGQCVGTGAGYFKSMVGNNTTEPSVGAQLSPQTWIGPLSLCELMSATSGNTGPAGETGPAGASGADGAKGDTGNDGSQGPRGDQGERGDTGDKGEKGDTGDTGQRGLQGDVGPAGAKGDTGDTGQKGDTGDAGPIGPQGDAGLDGEKGDKGDQGEQGIKGDQGLPFTPDSIVEVLPDDFECPATGVSSAFEASTGLLHFCVDGVRQPPVEFGRGEKGEQGEQGLKGDTGEQGIQGERGEQGETGRAGDKGDKGDKGDTGEQGIQGLTGADGAKGDKGDQGETGEQGPRGDQGLRGDTGPAGADGADGAVGPQGPQGIQGIQGPQGDFGGPEGPQGPAPEIGENGNWFTDGVDTGVPATGPRGLDYDPNCQAPVVTEISCADNQGNLVFLFDDDDTKLIHYKDFLPTAYSVAAAVEDESGSSVTTNPNTSQVVWFTEPSTNVIVSDFTPQGMIDDNHQLIEFDVKHRIHGGCLGKGRWLIKIECDNCNCTVPDFTRNPNGSITINDNKGVIFTIWPDNKGGLCSVPPEISEPDTHPDDEENCGNAFEGAFLRVRKFEKCSEGFPIGIVEHSGVYYINLMNGNTESPLTGVSSGSYLGGFEFFALINKMIDMQLEVKLPVLVDKRLRELGLIS